MRLERLRPAEIVDSMEARPIVYLPLGPLEWHGPHLPLGTDPMIAHAVALRAAGRTGGVVLPPFFWGTERERSRQQLRDIGFEGDEWVVGMDFPANTLKGLYCREEFFALLVREMVELLIEQGFRLIVIINGHGAQNHCAVLDRLSAEFTARGPAQVLALFAYADEDEERPGVGHAGSEETSRMMALFPETVDLSTLPPPAQPLSNVEWGIVDSLTFRGQPAEDHTVRDDPRAGSTPAEGERSLDRSVQAITRQVEGALGLGVQGSTRRAR
ncbi:creatininase family protein [Chloroflexota bacterium]